MVVGAASVVLAAVVAWGPVGSAPAPAPTPKPSPVIESPAPPPAPFPPPPAPARATSFLPPLFIAKAPLDARANPVLVATPARAKRERPPLYKQWLFWVVTGGLVASTVAATIIVTRPHQQPYTGDLFPYVVTFP